MEALSYTNTAWWKLKWIISFCISNLWAASVTHLSAFRRPSDRAAGCSFSNFTHPFTCDHK